MKLAIMKFFDKMLAVALFFVRKRAPGISTPKRILIIKLSAMGDAVCLMPAIRQLHQAFDGTQIDWFTSRRSVPQFFSAIKFIRRVYVLPTSPFNLLVFFIRHGFALCRYDLVIDFDQYYRISELISFLGKANAGFSTPLKGEKFSLSIQYDPVRNEKLLFLDLVNLVVGQYQGRRALYTPLLPELLDDFQPSSSLIAFADQCVRFNKPVLIIYPGSSPNAIYRRWPISRYIELIRQFDQACEIIVAGGPDELPLKTCLAQAGCTAFDYIGSWSLREWLWIFRNLRGVFIGNDAGLLHLAESQGMPIVGIFGPNIYSKWGSVNPASFAAESELGCRPCIKSYLGQVPRICMRGDVKCLADVSTESVAALIRKNLSATTMNNGTCIVND